MISIVIPTWNNLPYVKLCVESIRKNSTLPFQVILHINDGSDGTLEWAKTGQLLYTHTPVNAGICVAVNMAAALAQYDYIVYMNDDMYCCPGWDAALLQEIKEAGIDNFMISSTMIEPNDTQNPAVIFADFGKDIAGFKEAELLQALPSLKKNDWSGSSWPPCIMSKKYWHIVGGFSIEFSPGMGSDDDLSMKLWTAGCRYFKGTGKSLVYHFQTKSTGRIVKNDSRKQFLLKWGITNSSFNKYYIKKGMPFTGQLQEPTAEIMKKIRLKALWKKKFKY
jgi:glycosyltransferase involved in cell wall biosynthesis